MKLSPFLAQVLVYELLFGKNNLKRTGGKYTKLILKHQTRLQSELARLKIRQKVSKNEELIPESIRNAVVLPRYVRVNTHLATVDEVIGHFDKNHFKLVDYDPKKELKYDIILIAGCIETLY